MTEFTGSSGHNIRINDARARTGQGHNPEAMPLTSAQVILGLRTFDFYVEIKEILVNGFHIQPMTRTAGAPSLITNHPITNASAPLVCSLALSSLHIDGLAYA
ncbi:hypothetical protein J1614_010201 [Plenodomus biglobosus]|nr:hypothetical protein J1614_010201 [Plenodomus biglobosus]